MLHVTNPFNQGYEAYLLGADQSFNPYPRESDEHLSWNDGYACAEEGE